MGTGAPGKPGANRRAPLIPAVLCFVAGTAAGFEIALPFFLWCAAACVAGAVAALGLLRRQGGPPPWVSLAILVFFAALGGMFARGAAVPCDPLNVSHRLTPQPTLVGLRGWVVRPPLIAPKFSVHGKSAGRRYASFAIRVSQLCDGRGELPASGRVQVRVYPKWGWAPVRYGQIVHVTGPASLPAKPRNPGQFDMRRVLWMRGIDGVIRPKSSDRIDVQRGRRGLLLFRWIYDLRAWIFGLILTHFPPTEGSVLACLLVGAREAVPEELMESFARTGTIHFLAISGLHVGLAVGSLWYICAWLGLSRRARAGVAIVFVCLYMPLTGFRPSIQRAGIMTLILCGSFLLGRQWHFGSSLAASALFILALNPRGLFDLGFQLSFLAVIAIAYGVKDIEALLFGRPGIPRWLQAPEERNIVVDAVGTYLRKSIATSAAAWLGTLPLTAYYFHRISFSVLYMNVLIWILVWLILMLGFALALVGAVPLVGPLLALVSLWTARAVVWIVELGARLRMFYHYTPAPSLGWIFVYYVIGCMVLFRRRVPLPRFALPVVCLVAANAYAWSGMLCSVGPCAEVTVLDLGRGSAAVVRAGAVCVVCDVGGSWRFDGGKFIVAPYLWERRVRMLDAVFVSAPLYARCAGLPALVERFRVRNVFVPPRFTETVQRRGWLDGLRRERVCWHEMAAGERIEGLNPIQVRVLFPPRDNGLVDRMAIANRSLVLRIEMPRHRLLVANGLGEPGVRLLLTSDQDMRAEVLLAPHRVKSAEAFSRLVERVKPLWVIVGGKRVPSETDREICRKHNARILSTAELGAITLIEDGGRLRVETALYPRSPNR